MNISPINLLILLQLASDRFDRGQAKTLRQRIANDDRLRGQWKQLMKVKQHVEHSAVAVDSVNGSDVPRISDNFDIHDPVIETIASFIEGNLSPQRAEQFESDCWNSSTLLVEVVDAYLFGRKTKIKYSPSEHLANRLSSMYECIAGQKDSPVISLPAVKTDPITPSKLPTGIPNKLAAKHGWLIAAIAASVLILVGAVYSILPDSDNSDTAKNADQNSGKVDTDKVGTDKSLDEPELFQESSNPETRKPVNEFDRASELPKFTGFGANDGFDTDPSYDWSPSEIDIQTTKVEPPEKIEPSPVAQPESYAVKIDWDEVKGILAVRDRESEAWRGSKYDEQRETFEFATLAGSWASANTDGLGKIVFSHNTDLRIEQKDTSSSIFDMSLRQGRIAIRRPEAGSRINLSVGQAIWDIVIEQDKTVFVVDFSSPRPAVRVKTGRVMLDGEPLLRGQQAQWKKDAAPVITKFAQRDSWINSAPRENRESHIGDMGETALKEIQHSPDLAAHFEQVLNSGDNAGEPVRIVAAQMLLCMNPSSGVASLLKARDGRVGIEMFDWLVEQNPMEPHIRRMWASLARQTNNPTVIRSIVRWAGMVRRQEFLPRTEANKMLNLLENERYVLRYAGHYFLTKAFGSSKRYSPELPLRQRQRAIRSWREHVNETYMRLQRQGQQRNNPQRNATPRDNQQRTNPAANQNRNTKSTAKQRK